MAKDTIMTVSIMIPPANCSTITMGKSFVIGRVSVRYMHHVNGGSKHAMPFGKPPSGINAGFVFPPSPASGGKGFFPYKIRDFARAKRDKCWFLGRPPSGINTGFAGSSQTG